MNGVVKRVRRRVAANGDAVVDQALRICLQVVTGAAIMVTAHVLASVMSRSVKAALLARSNRNVAGVTATGGVPATGVPSVTLAGACVYWVIIVVGVMIVMQLLGLQTTGVLAILASGGFAFGLALQGALSDAAAGVMLSIDNTFVVGDLIEAGSVIGTVRRFSVFTTTVAERDSSHLVTIANRKLYGDILHNHTSMPTRSVRITFVVPNNNAPMGPVLRDVEAAVSRYPRVLRSPPVVASIGGVSERGLSVNVRVGIHSKDFPVIDNFDYTEALTAVVRDTLHAHGIPLVPGLRVIGNA